MANYYPELKSITPEKWDEYSGDNTRFDGIVWPAYETDERSKNPASVKQIYTHLSEAILDKRVRMTAGYAFDKSYQQGVKISNATGWSHTGIDFEAGGSSPIKAAVGGKIASVKEVKGLGFDNGWFIIVEAADKKNWVYGHLQNGINPLTKTQWKINDRVNVGTPIGNVGNQPGAKHLHLEVQNPGNLQSGSFLAKDPKYVTSITMSPLQAFWESKNSATGVVTINTTTINGTEASQTINGSASNEIINGLGGNDTLYGEGGNDSLNGGNGNDYLDGFTSKTGSDLDTLTGGTGIDTFVLGNSLQGVFYLGNGQATITDYSSSDDYIQLRGGANDYQLNPQGSDTMVALKNGDAIALIKNATDLSLTPRLGRVDFKFI